jgi:hypothetical protein
MIEHAFADAGIPFVSAAKAAPAPEEKHAPPGDGT